MLSQRQSGVSSRADAWLNRPCAARGIRRRLYRFSVAVVSADCLPSERDDDHHDEHDGDETDKEPFHSASARPLIIQIGLKNV